MPRSQSGCPIIGIEEINAKPRHRESCRLAAARGAGDDEHPRSHLSAEIAVDPIPHVGGKIAVHAFPVCIGNTEAFQLFRCCLNPLSGRLQMWVGLRSGQLCCMSRGHYVFIIFLPEDECDSTPSG